MSAREAILREVRRSLGRGPLSGDAVGEIARRLGKPTANLVPARSRRPHEELVALFVEMAEAADATLSRVQSLADVPGAVAEYVARHNLPTEIVAAPALGPVAVPWERRPLLGVRTGRAEEGDAVSVTPAFAGVAETGTLMLISGSETPTTLNFLPENHVVVLKAEDVVGALEEAWARLRRGRRRGRKGWDVPRTVNLVTGPSRSADIGLTLLLGAHGPRRLHVVLVEGGAGETPQARDKAKAGEHGKGAEEQA